MNNKYDVPPTLNQVKNVASYTSIPVQPEKHVFIPIIIIMVSTSRSKKVQYHLITVHLLPIVLLLPYLNIK